eukprot:15308570-Alexandrium_andersonii.AAC.1
MDEAAIPSQRLSALTSHVQGSAIRARSVNAAIRLTPQTAMRTNAKSLRALETGTVRAQEWPRNWSPKPWSGAFCTNSRAVSESTGE